jgi:ABC-2 type transport system ATP-binding protein
MTRESRAGVAVRNLFRAFGAKDVLRGVSFEIRRGEVLALLGVNGSGKSTLLEILATLLYPTSGSASIHGFDVGRDAAAVRRLIGYGPSSLHSFYPRLTGMQNLEFFGTLSGLGRRQIRVRGGALLERLNLLDAAGQRVERYSDGMKARLSIARALLPSPPVLLLDEPTKSLDPEGRESARQLLLEDHQAGESRTILWVTHDRQEAADVADRVGVLADGRVADEAGS